MNAPKWFADDLLQALRSVNGSREREHITALLQHAQRVRLDKDLTGAVTRTLYRALPTVEANLHKVSLFGSQSLWLEASHQDRLLSISRSEAAGPKEVFQAPAEVGYLLTADPESEGHIAVFVAWRRPDGGIFHSYALLHWDISIFAQRAQTAPGGPDQTVEERLMELASVVIPPGLNAEMEAWQSLEGDCEKQTLAKQQTTRDVLGEHLFLIVTLLMLDSDAVDMEEVTPPDFDEYEHPQMWVAHLAPRANRIFWPWKKYSGFKTPRFGGPLHWRQPLDDVSVRASLENNN